MNRTKAVSIIVILLMGIVVLYWFSLGNVEKFFVSRYIYGTTPTYYLEQETKKINSGKHCKDYRFIVMRSPFSELMPGIGDTSRNIIRSKEVEFFFSDVITMERGKRLKKYSKYIEIYNSSLVKNCLKNNRN